MLNRYKAQVETLAAQKTKLIQDLHKVCPTSSVLLSSMPEEGSEKMTLSSSSFSASSSSQGGHGISHVVKEAKQESTIKSLFSRAKKKDVNNDDGSLKDKNQEKPATVKASLSPRVVSAVKQMEEKNKMVTSTSPKATMPASAAGVTIEEGGRSSSVSAAPHVAMKNEFGTSLDDVPGLENNLTTVSQALEKLQLQYQEFKKYNDRIGKTSKPLQKIEQQEAFKDGLKGLQVKRKRPYLLAGACHAGLTLFRLSVLAQMELRKRKADLLKRMEEERAKAELEKKKAEQEAARKQAEDEAIANFTGQKRMDVDELAQEIAIGRQNKTVFFPDPNLF